MKIYISGKISGLEKHIVKENFKRVEEIILSQNDIPVNPLKNGLSEKNTWKEHMIKDIEMLMSCDAIFMMSNWIDSQGARIGHFIAKETNKTIIYN